jgi:hypothetical protein
MHLLEAGHGIRFRVLRANPAYQLRRWESMPEGYRRSLDGSVDLSTVVGVLVASPGSFLPDKLVDSAGAELFTMLRVPGRAPAAANDRLAELVLDAVLEVQTAKGFVCGPVAYEELVEPEGVPAPIDRVSRLSLAALAYAERLPILSIDRLTARMYGYHRVPLSTRWTRAYPGPVAVLDLLRRTNMARHWFGPAETGENVDWLSWIRHQTHVETNPASLPYKLYVSPHVDALPEALPAAITALTATSAPRFKLGADAAGLLRPDKLVVYLRDVHELEAVAHTLTRALAGVRPHGVPFSAELACNGLLSWGGDPPREAGPIGGGVESWRLSVCRRLAEHLVAARRAPLRRVRPMQYAMARLASDGVRFPMFAPAALAEPRDIGHVPGGDG